MIALRLARLSDSAALRRWRNDPSARRHFTARGAVGAAEHARWLGRALEDPRRRLFIIEDKGAAVGQVRLDFGVRGRAEVSITIDRRARGRGIGASALKAAATRARRAGATRLEALVSAGNPGSAAAFLKAGYRFVRLASRDGRPFYRMELPND